MNSLQTNLTNLNESVIVPSRDLLAQREDLSLKITELQTEYEHYKEYADTKIMELEDQIERFNA